jgi:hypothetical protein
LGKSWLAPVDGIKHIAAQNAFALEFSFLFFLFSGLDICFLFYIFAFVENTKGLRGQDLRVCLGW